MFGLAYEGNGDKWKGIEGKDSDGDGQLNGEELGDPCGAFLAGGAPGRATDISNPADKGSKATGPKTPDCAAMGGSSSSSGGGTTPPPPNPSSTGTTTPPAQTETTAAGPGTPQKAPDTGVGNACAAIAPTAPTGTGGALGALGLLLGGLALRRRARRRAP